LTRFGHNERSGGTGAKSIGVGGIGIGVDVAIGVIGGDGGMVVMLLLCIIR